MNSANLIQAIRGPVMLITLGLLFVIDHFGSYGFGSTWPLLVIIFGVLKLAERASAPAPAEPPQGGYRS
ncbi:MAG: hypothetical protein JSU00_14985 [Acidobacteria bacterium]|nr:hypothetical protein [Acidobacteriota bacterium]